MLCKAWKIGQLPERVARQLGRLLLIELSSPLHDDISGDVFEQSFFLASGGVWIGGGGLLDGTVQSTGYSLKTLQTLRDIYEIQTARIGDTKDNQIPRTDDPQLKGNAVIRNWNSRVEIVKKTKPDFRISVLLRDMTTNTFQLYEEPIKIYDINDIEWTEQESGVLWGINKNDGKKWLTWGKGGGHFKVVHKKPDNVVTIKLPTSIKENRPMTLFKKIASESDITIIRS